MGFQRGGRDGVRSGLHFASVEAFLNAVSKETKVNPVFVPFAGEPGVEMVDPDLIAYTNVVDTINNMKNAAAPQGCTNLKIRQLGRMLNRHHDHHMSAVGLKSTQYALLSCVVKLGPIRPSDLAQRLQMDASTLTRNLQHMVTQGWLVVGAGENARSRLIEATVAGQAPRAEAQRAWKAAQTVLNHQLGVAQVSALHEWLDASIAALDEASIDETPL